MATLGQVALRGNAQAFEYLLNRTARHPLGEFRWLSEALKRELDEEIPSLLLRLSDPKSKDYQDYLIGRHTRVRSLMDGDSDRPTRGSGPEVHLVEADDAAEDRVLAAILFEHSHMGWDEAAETVRAMSDAEREQLLDGYLADRPARWYKVGRALENAYLRFEILVDIGSYRDLHRHRMMTQQRQLFSTHHGYDVPAELTEAGLASPFVAALERAAQLFEKIESGNADLAQYAVPLAYRVRFYQWQNFRQFFWETELRTISQGHPTYRHIEQEKYRLVHDLFPLLSQYLLVDLNDYGIARRGTEEKIAGKEERIISRLRRNRGP
jgi:thymidylate synthase ThyX